MSSTTDTYLLLRAFVEELARCGMRHACTSPGSRCAPLVLTLAREQRLRCFSHVDERCAGFFALGLAKASGRPVAVTCTSGTAAAELLPAAVEAREARVPLLLLTADRPAELRENGAGQAIDQLGLYGSAAKWFFEVEMTAATPQALRWVRTLACRVYWSALEGRPGAVHLNFPLREPLTSEGELPADDSARPGYLPYLTRAGSAAAPTGDARERLQSLLGGERRGVIVAGRHERAAPLGEAAAAFALSAGWPLLADPLSSARRGDAAIAHYDALLRDAGFASEMRPEVVLRVGDLPVSKPLRTWLAGLGDTPQIALDGEGAWQDPDAMLGESLALEPASALAALTGHIQPAPGDWLAGWGAGDRQAAEAIAAEIVGEGLSEPLLAAELGALLPASSTLFVASSMPVRDIETFWPARPDPPRVLCNRGASGIDGTISSAFGAAAEGSGPVVLLIGDVALAHDIGGLLAAGRLALALTIVLVNNGGGGIFDFLPVAGAAMARARNLAGGAPAGEDQDVYTAHIATPTGLDFAAAATLYGLRHALVADRESLRAELEAALGSRSSSILEVRGERARNVALHRRVWRRVSEELSR